nr:unnamed protein product [Spirometra erinaceieuropaei]
MRSPVVLFWLLGLTVLAASLQPQDPADLDQLVDEVSTATAEEEERELHGDEVLAPARIPLRPLGRFAGRAIRSGARVVGRVARKVWSGAKRVAVEVIGEVEKPDISVTVTKLSVLRTLVTLNDYLIPVISGDLFLTPYHLEERCDAGLAESADVHPGSASVLASPSPSPVPVESRNFLQRLEMMLFRGYRLAPLRFVISHTQTASLGTAAFPVDLNHVTLLGSVASNGVTIESWKGDRELAVFNLLTRARYRSADRFLMKLVYHRIHVFDQPLINRIRGLCQGDRVCVIGALTSFRKSSNDWMQCITAQNVILHGAAGQEVEPPAEDLAGTADEP